MFKQLLQEIWTCHVPLIRPKSINISQQEICQFYTSVPERRLQFSMMIYELYGLEEDHVIVATDEP